MKAIATIEVDMAALPLIMAEEVVVSDPLPMFHESRGIPMNLVSMVPLEEVKTMRTESSILKKLTFKVSTLIGMMTFLWNVLKKL
jgi:hypothetical protein